MRLLRNRQGPTVIFYGKFIRLIIFDYTYARKTRPGKSHNFQRLVLSKFTRYEIVLKFVLDTFRGDRAVANDGDADGVRGRGASPSATAAAAAAAFDTEKATGVRGGHDRLAIRAIGGHGRRRGSRRLEGGVAARAAGRIRRRRGAVLSPGRQHGGHRIGGHAAAAAAPAQVSAAGSPPSPSRRRRRRRPSPPAATRAARHRQEARGRVVRAAGVHVFRGVRRRADAPGAAAAAPPTPLFVGQRGLGGRQGVRGRHRDRHGRRRRAPRVTVEPRPPPVVRHGNRSAGQRPDQNMRPTPRVVRRCGGRWCRWCRWWWWR